MTAHKQDTHFIPSPFKVVTQYENAFIKSWNEGVAHAMSDILKYIANVTASVIKEKRFDKDDIQKARNVGDIHPNGKWIWTEYKPGKFDWRVRKQEVEQCWDILPEIDKLQTSLECEEYIKNLLLITPNSQISSMDVKSAKSICSAAIILHKRIPFQSIEMVVEHLDAGITADATAGRRVRFSTIFNDFDPLRYYRSVGSEGYVNKLKEFLHSADKFMKQELQKDPNADVTRFLRIKKKTEMKLAKYPRWTYSHEETQTIDLFLHEMGHILNVQCTGAIGYHKSGVYQLRHSAEEKKLHQELNDEGRGVFERYLKEGKIISEYSTKNHVEAFAEWFVAWVHNDSELPSYVKIYMDKYFKLTTPKR